MGQINTTWICSEQSSSYFMKNGEKLAKSEKELVTKIDRESAIKLILPYIRYSPYRCLGIGRGPVMRESFQTLKSTRCNEGLEYPKSWVRTRISTFYKEIFDHLGRSHREFLKCRAIR